MMSLSWSRLFKSAYRKEPVTGFIVMVGAVDVVIGGAGASGSLLVFGLGTVGVALAWRWWQIQRSRVDEPTPAPEYYLPPQSSRPSLPMLSISKNHPPY
jgi:hypothetical protein